MTAASVHSSSPNYAACLAAASIAAAATVAAWFPLHLSIASVFLFAGPHNWIEARYMLSRLPARWGKLRNFFRLSISGVFTLTLTFALLPHLQHWLRLPSQWYPFFLSIWCTLLVIWIGGLARLREKQPPRRNWEFLPATLLAAAASAWLAPHAFSLAVLYAHPLLAFWLLDRELIRSRPHWRRQYHRVMILIPIFALALIAALHDNPALPTSTKTAERIIAHSGAFWFPSISNHLLVAIHAFLELAHYGIWIFAIPLANEKMWQSAARSIPLAKRSPAWKLAVVTFIAGGGLLVVLLWLGFLADYPTTRDLYFTIAMIHVLAEIPFLLRAL